MHLLFEIYKGKLVLPLKSSVYFRLYIHLSLGFLAGVHWVGLLKTLCYVCI